MRRKVFGFFLLFLVLCLPLEAKAETVEDPIHQDFFNMVFELSGGMHLHRDFVPYLGLAVLTRFNQIVVPLELGLRYNWFKAGFGDFHSLSFPLRMRHVWNFGSWSWDLLYGVDLNIHSLESRPFVGYSFWLGTGWNYNFDDLSWGIGLSVAYQSFKQEYCHYEYGCDMLIPYLLHTRISF